MKKWICLGLVCVLLSLLACAGMAESPTEVEDAEMSSFRALAETYVPMAVEDCPDHTVFQVIGSMEIAALSFMVQEPNEIMEWASEMSLRSRRLM